MVECEFCSGEPSDDDIPAINELLPFLATNPVDITLSDVAEVAKNSRLLLARDEDGKVIGMATLAVVTVMTARYGRIEDVVVHDKFRGQGIGKALTKKLIGEAKNLGLVRVDLTSRPKRIEANKLYQSLGFESVETNMYRLKLEV